MPLQLPATVLKSHKRSSPKRKKSPSPHHKKKRCPNGEHRDKKTGDCKKVRTRSPSPKRK